jgi:hypothetical protein
MKNHNTITHTELKDIIAQAEEIKKSGSSLYKLGGSFLTKSELGNIYKGGYNKSQASKFLGPKKWPILHEGGAVMNVFSYSVKYMHTLAPAYMNHVNQESFIVSTFVFMRHEWAVFAPSYLKNGTFINVVHLFDNSDQVVPSNKDDTGKNSVKSLTAQMFMDIVQHEIYCLNEWIVMTITSRRAINTLNMQLATSDGGGGGVFVYSFGVARSQAASNIVS